MSFISQDDTLTFSGGDREGVVNFDDVDISIHKDNKSFTCELNFKGVPMDDPIIDMWTTDISVNHDIGELGRHCSFSGVVMTDLEFKTDSIFDDKMFLRIEFHCSNVRI